MLLLAFGATIAVLDLVFRRSAEQALGDQLETQVSALIGAAEPDEDDQLTVPLRLLEPRLRNPGSGLYAEIRDGAGNPLWRSPSAAGLDLTPQVIVPAGTRQLTRQTLADGSEALVLGIGISWELGPEITPAFQVFAASDMAPYDMQLTRFRQQLLGWFTVVMLGLLVALWFAVRLGLRPLRRMAAEIAAVESGARSGLGNDYPEELAGVVRGLNTLLRSERQRMDRYRTTMDDLAHSLKTPIAVMGSELSAGTPDAVVLREQVERMQGVIDYQLRRAAATGPRSLAAKPVALAPLATEIAVSLRKIHRQKDVEWTLEVTGPAAYPAEQGDLYEILGNLLENAWKWCAGRVDLTIAPLLPARRGGLRLIVSDDGPGIPSDQSEAVLARGIRADQRGDVPGQGIGLAIVREIVGLYGGEVAIARSALGGAEVTVELPPR